MSSSTITILSYPRLRTFPDWSSSPLKPLALFSRTRFNNCGATSLDRSLSKILVQHLYGTRLWAMYGSPHTLPLSPHGISTPRLDCLSTLSTLRHTIYHLTWGCQRRQGCSQSALPSSCSASVVSCRRKKTPNSSISVILHRIERWKLLHVGRPIQSCALGCLGL